MTARHPWGDASREAVLLGSEEERLLALVALLPLAPLAVLEPFLAGGPASAHRRARQLLDRGLLCAVATPLRTAGRPARLLWPTGQGLGMLAHRRATEPAALIRGLGLHGATQARLMAQLPSLLPLYELLRLLAAAGPGPATLDRWEHPWRRLVPSRAELTGRAPRVVQLPAAATLTWSGPDGPISKQYLLVPDTGGLALPAMRATLGRLAELQAAGAAQATLLIATTTSRRAAAWAALLEAACRKRHLPPLAFQVTSWNELHEAARATDQQNGLRQALATTRRRQVVVPAGGPSDTLSTISAGIPPTGPRCPRPGLSRLAAEPDLVLGPLDRAVLDLVGRHPFLPTDSLAAVLDRDVCWVRRRRARLVARGLLRVVPAAEVDPPELARRSLLELTPQGLTALAAHLGLPLGVAVRHHGLAGGGPAAPIGPRAALVAHLPHTLGADGVFSALARAARAQGGALLEWRGPATCAHGRLRPDGYGLLRVGRRDVGFFLEFDRGTMRPSRLRAKFVAYHRYRRSAHAERAYAGFPTILVVTASPGAEVRLARAVLAADVGQAGPLPVLLTTTAWLAASPGGPLGRVWRTAQCTTRSAWPPSREAGRPIAGWFDQRVSPDTLALSPSDPRKEGTINTRPRSAPAVREHAGAGRLAPKEGSPHVKGSEDRPTDDTAAGAGGRPGAA